MTPRQAPDPAALDAFVNGTTAALPQPEPAPAPPPAVPEPEAARGKKKPKSSPMRRADKGKGIKIYFPPDMAKKLRIRAAREERSVSHAVTEAVGLWLSRDLTQGV
jgi:hypothetical protein